MSYLKSLYLAMDLSTPQLFSEFATQYGFTYTTTSPQFLQANGTARDVRIVKDLLNKSDEPYLVILTYKSTALEKLMASYRTFNG